MLRKRLKRILLSFFDGKLDFRIRVFNMLGTVGALSSIVGAAASLVNGEPLASTLSNVATMFASISLMVYARKSGRYRVCYILTILFVFLLFFPVIFVNGGAYKGAMPCFFVFAVVFTAFMVDGRAAFALMALELAVYVGLCVCAYFFPGYFVFHTDELTIMVDMLVGIIGSSVALSVSMLLLFRMYKRQQLQLEQAREEALELSRAKTNFLANMSHEIRTPINVMLGMNEMIMRESGEEAVREYSAGVESAGGTLLNLISNVLDVSQIESGRMEMLEEPYRVETLVHELALVGQGQARAKGLQFLLQVAQDVPPVLCGDFLRLKQIAVNFLSNAIKYTHQGQVRLSVAQAPAENKDEVLLRIMVQDTGIGIRAEDIDGLFDAFSRVDLSAHRNIEGSGLGLSISRELAGLMGGHIRVESEYGRGSRFTVELPQRLAAEEDIPAEAGPGTGGRRSLVCPAGRVLVVDDSKENLQVMKALLRRTLLQVDVAESGAQCLEKLEDNHYHVILLDYMMPDMDGLETRREILRLYPHFNTPVVALTANAAAGAREMFLQEGFAAYLAKPVGWRELEELLAGLLPEELLSFGGETAALAVTGEAQAELARVLEEGGVSLEAGLRYLSGDLLQYGRLAELFLENYGPGREEMECILARRDFAALQMRAHSLKSRAKAMGAGELFFSARYVEENCGAGRNAFALAAMPVLLQEWARAAEGLRAFTDLLARFVPAEPVKAEQAGEVPGSRRALLGHIRACRRREARREVDALARGASPEEQARWAAVRTALENLDFEEAGRLAEGEEARENDD